MLDKGVSTQSLSPAANISGSLESTPATSRYLRTVRRCRGALLRSEGTSDIAHLSPRRMPQHARLLFTTWREVESERGPASDHGSRTKRSA